MQCKHQRVYFYLLRCLQGSQPQDFLFSTHLIICDYKNNITNENVILLVIIKLFQLYTEVILEMNPIHQDLFPLILSV